MDEGNARGRELFVHYGCVNVGIRIYIRVTGVERIGEEGK